MGADPALPVELPTIWVTARLPTVRCSVCKSLGVKVAGSAWARWMMAEVMGRRWRDGKALWLAALSGALRWGWSLLSIVPPWLAGFLQKQTPVIRHRGYARLYSD